VDSESEYHAGPIRLVRRYFRQAPWHVLRCGLFETSGKSRHRIAWRTYPHARPTVGNSSRAPQSQSSWDRPSSVELHHTPTPLTGQFCESVVLIARDIFPCKKGRSTRKGAPVGPRTRVPDLLRSSFKAPSWWMCVLLTRRDIFPCKKGRSPQKGTSVGPRTLVFGLLRSSLVSSSLPRLGDPNRGGCVLLTKRETFPCKKGRSARKGASVNPKNESFGSLPLLLGLLWPFPRVHSNPSQLQTLHQTSRESQRQALGVF
jgi:hypothetical protein